MSGALERKCHRRRLEMPTRRFGHLNALEHDPIMRRVPFFILLLLAADAVLIVLPAIDLALGSPFSKIRHLVSLDDETTLQAWYSSMQWFVAACLYGALFIYAYRSKLRGAVAVGLFASLCLAFSVDEIVWIHEWLGQKSDALLPGGTRKSTILSRTGIWPVLIGVPVLIALAIIVARARSLFFPHSPRAFRLLAIGLIVMFTGALAIELTVNALERPIQYGWINFLQHASEEFMEMLGVTIIVWSGLEILQAHGIELHMPDAAVHPAQREALLKMGLGLGARDLGRGQQRASARG